MADDQSDVIEFLSKPSSYEHECERVYVIQTHASLLFLAGERAYKLKRAVRYPYLDFSTAERRRQACETELALNRRTAPTLYLEVRAVARTPDGAVSFAANEPAIDWLVVMRRFEDGSLFDNLARSGELTAPLIRELADHIAAFHRKAERRPEYGGAAAMSAVIETNHRCLSEAPAAGFEPKRIDELRRESVERLAAVAGLLDRRRAEGKVRRCHGDLHLRNVCLLEGKPTLFDCLEFSDELASIDILYDLAFVLMDLEHRGLGDFANLTLNRYLDLTGEDEGLAAMPLFQSSRAAIRAHVTATAMASAGSASNSEMAAEARSYLDLALRSLQPGSCRLIAVGGLSGSGKSTLAAALAPSFGARVLRSDVIRKRLFGVAPESSLPETAYTAEASHQVYAELCRRAAELLATGCSVIIDAVSLKPAERQSFAAVAEAAGVPFSGLWLEAPTLTMDGRLRTRHSDASDATPDVLALQLRQDPGPMDWVRIDAGGGPGDCLAAARRALAPT